MTNRRSPLSFRPPKLTPRAEFKPELFRKLQFTQGSLLEWQKSQPCPCTTLVGLTPLSDSLNATEEPSIDCPTCEGRGYFYRDTQEIYGLVVSAARNPDFYKLYGERAKGMASITLDPEHMASSWDRFTVIGDRTGRSTVHQVREVREREGDVETLRYPIVTTELETGLSEDQPSVLDVTENDGVVIFRASTQGLTVPTVLDYGVDYRVTGGNIEWLGTVGVAAEGDFIITGDAGGVVPIGTRWRYTAMGQEPREFATLETVELGASGQSTVRMRCTTEGTFGNLAILGLQVTILHELENVDTTARCQLGTSGGVNGNVPPVGGRYSVTYWAHPVYVAQDVPHSHRDTRVSAKSPTGPKWDRMVYQVHAWLETMGPPHGYVQDVTAG